jgi:hypothetical protein
MSLSSVSSSCKDLLERISPGSPQDLLLRIGRPRRRPTQSVRTLQCGHTVWEKKVPFTPVTPTGESKNNSSVIITIIIITIIIIKNIIIIISIIIIIIIITIIIIIFYLTILYIHGLPLIFLYSLKTIKHQALSGVHEDRHEDEPGVPAYLDENLGYWMILGYFFFPETKLLGNISKYGLFTLIPRESPGGKHG